ncbi:MAG: DUF924 family protein [Spongiibacteraceae bacterium]
MRDQDGIEAILDYWFGDIGAGFEVSQQQHARWFGGSKEVDVAIKQQFGTLVEQALQGLLQHWWQVPGGVLALVLLLDQFTRNIYRGTARAFAGDSQAKAMVVAALQQQLDQQLTFIQRSFFYLPLEHSEVLEDQQRSVELFEQLLQQAPVAGQARLQSSLKYAVHHRDIIQRFGRFPHRNKALGRQSTVAELDFLMQGGARFGQ